MSECIFCKFIADEEFRSGPAFLMEDEHAFAFLDNSPLNPGHALIIPKVHISDLFDIGDDVYTHIFAMVPKVKELLESKGFHADGFNVGVNVGAAAGQTIGHAHVHLIPRLTGDAQYNNTGDIRGGIRWVVPARAAYWPDAQFYVEPMTKDELDGISWAAGRQMEIMNLETDSPLHTGWMKLCLLRGTLDPVEEWLEAEDSWRSKQELSDKDGSAEQDL